jgi:hypothetical protein
MRALAVVKCQWALVHRELRSCCQAASSSTRVCLSAMGRLRRDRAFNIDPPTSSYATTFLAGPTVPSAVGAWESLTSKPGIREQHRSKSVLRLCPLHDRFSTKNSHDVRFVPRPGLSRCSKLNRYSITSSPSAMSVGGMASLTCLGATRSSLTCFGGYPIARPIDSLR